MEEAGTMIPIPMYPTSCKLLQEFKNLDEIEFFSIRWHTLSVD